jgi:FKBP-type peptidyl-prolyl cis-trans isomerase FkpA
MKKPQTFSITITRILTAATILATCTYAFAADTPALTEEQKTLYAIGASVSRSLAVFELTPAEFEFVKQGLTDAQTGKKSAVEVSTYTGKIQELAKIRRKVSGDRQVSSGKDFLEKAAKEKGAVKTASGMVYTMISEGKGDSPKADDVVKVNYRGTLIDGKEFDSSYKRARPLEFKLDNVIKCWTEGVQRMKPGGKARLVCPPDLAYGDSGAGEMILPGATLAFEVELLEFKKTDAVKPGSAAPGKPAVPAKAEQAAEPVKK